jgi:hypothetical protein
MIDFEDHFRAPPVTPAQHADNVALVQRLRRRFPRLDFHMESFDLGHAIGLCAARTLPDLSDQRRIAIACRGATLPPDLVDRMSQAILSQLYGDWCAP